MVSALAEIAAAVPGLTAFTSCERTGQASASAELLAAREAGVLQLLHGTLTLREIG